MNTVTVFRIEDKVVQNNLDTNLINKYEENLEDYQLAITGDSVIIMDRGRRVGALRLDTSIDDPQEPLSKLLYRDND